MKQLGEQLATLLLLIIWAGVSQSLATTIRVPADRATIQAGIDSAVNGDTVLVAPGTYIENVNYFGKGIRLISTGGSTWTILEPARQDVPIVTAYRAPGDTATLEGFTIRNATNSRGIQCDYWPMVISGCEVYGCSIDDDGAGMFLSAPVTVRNCSIHSNRAGTGGGGICLTSTYGSVIENCTVYENQAPYGAGIAVYGSGGIAEIRYNYIYGNSDTGKWAAGIYQRGRSLRIINNTVVANYRGVACDGVDYTLLLNNVVANNIISGVSGITYSVIPIYNDFWSNGENDTLNYYGISADPLFVDANHDNYSLQPESPCIDRGSPDTLYRDPDGSRSDIGAFTYTHQLPLPNRIGFGSDVADHLTDHYPVIHWVYFDTTGLSQQAFEIQVSSTQVPFQPDIWAANGGGDTTIAYAGSALLDGVTYYVRIRLNNGINWGSWSYTQFHMNLPPGIPVPTRPINDQTAFAGAVQLVVDTSSNPESDTSIRYDFQLFGSDDTVGGPLQSLTEQAHPYSGFFVNLQINKRYWWRARGFDGYEYSLWSGLASFVTRGNTTIRVPSQFATIQAAIAAASANDTVLIAGGTYRGAGNRDLEFSEKPLIVKGTIGSSPTILDCQASVTDPHRGFVCRSRYDTGIVIRNLTITNGYATRGGAVAGNGARMMFDNCTFAGNHAVRGGVTCSEVDGSWSPTFRNCVFTNNQADFGGGVAFQASGQFMNCRFSGNQSPNGSVGAFLSTRFDSCVFDRNGGIVFMSDFSQYRWCLFSRNTTCLSGGNSRLENCTFYGNQAVGDFYPTTGPVMSSCLFVFNTGYTTCCCNYPKDPPTTFFLDHCILFGNTYEWGGCYGKNKDLRENRVVDPRLCDTTGLDFGLAANSPCIGTGVGGTNIGAFGMNCAPTSSDDNSEMLPLSFELSQNYPNPFNPSTRIEFSLPHRVDVSLVVYNVLGQRVAELVHERMSAGLHSVLWTGRSDAGDAVTSGVYFYRLKTGDFVATRKMLLLK